MDKCGDVVFEISIDMHVFDRLAHFQDFFRCGEIAQDDIVLLAFTLGAFWLQHAWLGKKMYTTVTGNDDSGDPLPLPGRVAIA